MRPDRVLPAALLLLLGTTLAPAADWPQWGGGPTRNPVSLETGLSLDFALPEIGDRGKVTNSGRSIAWLAELGSQAVIPPVVAGGLVWVGTNARDPDNPKLKDKDWDGGVLMCFRESDGKVLWKHRTPRLGKFIADWPYAALGSAPLVEADRLWYVNNRHEVVYLDIAPLKKGTGEPREVWKLDKQKELGVFPYLPGMQGGFAASVAGYKDKLYVVTHNGVDETHVNIPSPNSPSLVCLVLQP